MDGVANLQQCGMKADLRWGQQRGQERRGFMPWWLTGRTSSRSVPNGDGGRDSRRSVLLWLRVPERWTKKGCTWRC